MSNALKEQGVNGFMLSLERRDQDSNGRIRDMCPFKLKDVDATGTKQWETWVSPRDAVVEDPP